MQKPIMTTKEVAELLGLSMKEVRRLQAEGHLKSLKGFRNPLKFNRSKIVEYLEQTMAV